MKMESDILTECNVDTLIAKTILYPKKDYMHKKGCNNVLKAMREEFANQAAFGIIDDDKSVPQVIQEDFSLLKKHNEQLSIYKHKNKPHYIVKLSKAAEDFTLKNAEKCHIALSDYNLPSDLEGLKNRTKKSVSLLDADLKRLFLALKQDENSDFHKLTQWIELFKANPYNIDIEQL